MHTGIRAIRFSRTTPTIVVPLLAQELIPTLVARPRDLGRGQRRAAVCNLCWSLQRLRGTVQHISCSRQPGLHPAAGPPSATQWPWPLWTRPWSTALRPTLRNGRSSHAWPTRAPSVGSGGLGSFGCLMKKEVPNIVVEKDEQEKWNAYWRAKKPCPETPPCSDGFLPCSWASRQDRKAPSLLSLVFPSMLWALHVSGILTQSTGSIRMHADSLC